MAEIGASVWEPRIIAHRYIQQDPAAGPFEMVIDRRSLLVAAALAATSSRGRAQAEPDAIALWPDAPPGGSGPQSPERIDDKGSVTNVSNPRLIVYRPSKPSGAAVIVIAGGGYAHIEAGRESAPTCRWLQSNDATAFELIYRLPGEGWSRNAPFQDGRRAIRLVRSRAPSFAIDPDRIGMIGFSAGGHLAGMIAVNALNQPYSPVDDIDANSVRPDFCGLIYPVLSMMPPFDRTHTRREIIGKEPSEAESEAYSVERHVGKDTPPTFLAQAADDPISPVDNSLMMFDALRANRIKAEMHIFQSGGHGWGMGDAGTEVRAWPELFLRWTAQNSLLPVRRDKG